MAQETSEFDVIIIGGGPGGLSAAFWCVGLGLNAVLLEEQSEFGGQLLRTYNPVKDHLGAVAANGRDMRDIFLRQIEDAGVVRRCGSAVLKAQLAEKKVVLADDVEYSAFAIVIATGVSRRRLGVPGEAEFAGRGVLLSGVKDKASVTGKRVAVVGGGDAALENALILSEDAAHVFVVHRRSELSGRSEFVERCCQEAKIELLLNSEVAAIIGNTTVEGVLVKNRATGLSNKISVDAVLIRVGEVPNTDLFTGQVELDQRGFIKINSDCSTSLANVYAIGDVASPNTPTISGAVGMGATAAKSIMARLKGRNG